MKFVIDHQIIAFRPKCKWWKLAIRTETIRVHSIQSSNGNYMKQINPGMEKKQKITQKMTREKQKHK